MSRHVISCKKCSLDVTLVTDVPHVLEYEGCRGSRRQIRMQCELLWQPVVQVLLQAESTACALPVVLNLEPLTALLV